MSCSSGQILRTAVDGKHIRMRKTKEIPGSGPIESKTQKKVFQLGSKENDGKERRKLSFPSLDHSKISPLKEEKLILLIL